MSIKSFLWGAVIVLFALNVFQILNPKVTKGDIIEVPKDTQIMISLGNTPWEGLPATLKEHIAKRSSATKLSLNDLQDLVLYYQNLMISYKEPVSIKK